MMKENKKGGKPPLRALGSKKGFTIEGEVTDQVVDKVIGLVQGKFAWAVQPSENSDDAGAPSIHFTIDSKNQIVIIDDDGHGLGELGFRALCKLGASYKPLRGAKGKHGTGFKVLFTVAEKVTVIDRHESYGPDAVQVLVLRGAEYRKSVNKGGLYETTPAPVPKGFQRTGVRIIIEEWKARKFPDATEVIESLGGLLFTTVAKKVRVNGMELKEVERENSIVRETFNDKHLGLIYVDLYVSKKGSDSDIFFMGSKGRVCTFQEFKSHISEPKLLRRIPPVFDEVGIRGGIDIPLLNEKSSMMDRGRFSDEFYDGHDLIYFIQFLELVLAQRVADYFGVRYSAEAELLAEELVNTMREKLTAAFGEASGEVISIDRVIVDKNERPFVLNTHRVTIVSGDSIEIFISKTNHSSGKYDWDTTGCGGTVKLIHETRIEYTAGSEAGIFEIVVSDSIDPKLSQTVSIKVVEEKEFMLSPREVTILPGESRMIRAMNTDVTSGIFEWRIDAGGLLVVSKDTHECEFTAGTLPRTVTVYCIDKRDPKRTATCDIEVVAERRPRKPSEERLERVHQHVPSDRVKIEDEEYIISIAEHDYSPTKRKREGGNPLVKLDLGNRFTLFTNHPSHVKAKADGSNAVLNLLFTQLVVCHVMNVDPGIDLATLAGRVGDLLEQLICKRKK